MPRRITTKLAIYHDKIPGLRKIPGRAIAAIAGVAGANIIVWIIAGIILSYHPALVSTCVLAYSLGLRHALDADHISAIDMMTRRLLASGQKPVTVGLFFSLGHSTIVVITALVVAASASAIVHKFDAFSTVGGIVGSAVSASFLIILGVINAYILARLVIALRKQIATPPGTTQGFRFEGAGCLFLILRKLFRLIDRPWKMYPLGVLFGLGFDTSSEIALLGISSIQAARGTSLWLILVFPVLFTAGMCLLDTADGALMMALYSSTELAEDHIAILYYSIVLTGVTVVVALVIGSIQLLTLILNVTNAQGAFWDGVANAGNHYDVIGGGICGSFVVFGLLSVVVYRPWRRRVDAERLARFGPGVQLSRYGDVELAEIEAPIGETQSLADAEKPQPSINDRALILIEQQ